MPLQINNLYSYIIRGKLILVLSSVLYNTLSSYVLDFFLNICDNSVMHVVKKSLVSCLRKKKNFLEMFLKACRLLLMIGSFEAPDLCEQGVAYNSHST